MQVARQSVSADRALADYLSPIFDETCADAPRLAVAVSGGADSMALALLAHAWCGEQGATPVALTVDHGLRAESAAEARQVQAWLKARGMAHHILAPLADGRIANTQTRAREMRYRALTDWCRAHRIHHLLVAHHADDQAETVALQRHRGETPPSRAGMALVRERHGIRLVRPLLGVRKHHLLSYLRDHDQPWLEDPSNAGDAYARNRLRRTLSDADTLALWHEAQRMGAQRHAEDAARNAWLQHHAQGGVCDLAALRNLPELRRTDLLSHLIRCIGGKEFRPRRSETARLDERLCCEMAGAATLGHCRIRWADGRLHITPEHPLDPVAHAPHITPANPPKPLVSPPFWWFNHRLF